MPEERRRTNQVSDPPIERGVKLNNYLMSIALVMGTGIGSWMGLNIEKIKETLTAITADVRENKTEIRAIKGDIDDIKKGVSMNSQEIIILKGINNIKKARNDKRQR